MFDDKKLYNDWLCANDKKAVSYFFSVVIVREKDINLLKIGI